jgi:hypothetical protein
MRRPKAPTHSFPFVRLLQLVKSCEARSPPAERSGRGRISQGAQRAALCLHGCGRADERGLRSNIEQFVADEGIDLVSFGKRQRKDDVTQKYLRRFRRSKAVLYVGKAQEKARLMRTERRRSRITGGTYPWIVETTAMVNHYYFYCVD